MRRALHWCKVNGAYTCCRECETVGAVCADVNRAASLVARQAPWKLPLHLEELDKRCKGEMQRIRVSLGGATL